MPEVRQIPLSYHHPAYSGSGAQMKFHEFSEPVLLPASLRKIVPRASEKHQNIDPEFIKLQTTYLVRQDAFVTLSIHESLVPGAPSV